ncbi:hypothetical protein BLS_001157 [Venturia inaequalis]|uniref:Rhodopsin domain-containing protein n=1 Tax=Venturia inaequalis TaxID=5025 RepID=A0A8H3YLD8_VENIN|nr:hypothetical protein BLS_001157 [Venturia inaequalis]KAE9967554.1 hypothetical protein EG327_011393 [Venturia inaequalis]RDI77276.1 hypothetical protein Vi05172_g12709 [Venturia inaequalis]
MVPELFPNGRWRNPSAVLVSLQIVFISIATICVTLRLFTRISLKRRIAVDDIFIVIGLSLAIARAVVASLSSQSGWASRMGPEADYQIPYYTHYFERRLLYALSAFFIRAGVLVYYLRLFPTALVRLRQSSWVLLALSLAQMLQLVIMLAYFCNDLKDLYRGNILGYSNPRCSNAYAFTYSGAIGDAAIDFMIYILPIPYVWGLRRLRLDQRLGLVFVFGVGIIACVFALLQIPFIIKNYRHNPVTKESYFGSQVSLFIAIELALGLVAASLPDLRGLIARSVPGFMGAFRHTDDSSSGPSDPRRESGSNALGENEPRGVVSIGGGIRIGGEGIGWTGMGRKIKKPDWLRSNHESLFRDSPPSTIRTRTRRDGSSERVEIQGDVIEEAISEQSNLRAIEVAREVVIRENENIETPPG